MIAAQRCVCGTTYEVPLGVPLRELACPKCGRPPGMDPGGAFVFLDERPPELAEAKRA